MKYLFVFVLLSLLLIRCSNNSKSKFNYDPSVSYHKFEPGDFWMNKFDRRGLQNSYVEQNKLYCNTINARGTENYLYCFNLINGKVEWRANVSAFATQPVTIQNDIIIYSSYVGKLHAFDMNGISIWNNPIPKSYSGHWLNPMDQHLYVHTVQGKGYVYNIETGNLQKEIETKSVVSAHENWKIRKTIKKRKYTVTENNTTYSCTVTESENREKAFEIEITNIN